VIALLEKDELKEAAYAVVAQLRVLENALDAERLIHVDLQKRQ